MPTETHGDYEIDYQGQFLADVEGWAAFITVYGPSDNPMHRNIVLPAQRVSVEHVYPTEEEAAREALRVALTML
jgi:hypothetical protein